MDLKTRVSPKKAYFWFAFSFCTLRPQGGAIYEPAGIKGNEALFQLLLQVILFHVASEVNLITEYHSVLYVNY